LADAGRRGVQLRRQRSARADDLQVFSTTFEHRGRDRDTICISQTTAVLRIETYRRVLIMNAIITHALLRGISLSTFAGAPP
jgi:hypothetical protein